MNTLAPHVLGKLNKVALAYTEDGYFELINDALPWFSAIWGDETRLRLIGFSEYLDNFVIDAIEHWNSESQDVLSSGPFLESVEGYSELPLEAEAIRVDHALILMLTNLGESYEKNLNLLQAARRNLLSNEQLEMEVSKRTAKIRQRETEISGRLIYAAGFRDEETGAHIRRIGLYSAEMGRALGWSQFAVEDICAAAPMHDIGKIGIPDEILKKPGKLTDAEFEVMKTHPAIGAEILGDSEIDMIEMAAEIAGSHHEHWDGSGYPKGLQGDEIPIAARIVAIVDVYDALVHSRVYKPAFSEAEALKMMASLVGTQFDPELYALFLERLPAMRDIRKQFQD
ncbi:MAG: HD-GYP domain-containing protein [Pseudohongiellaceae bacterium]